MPSPLVQDLMAESITFVIAASPAFVAGFDSGTENGGGDQGDDNKEGVLGHGADGGDHCCKARSLFLGLKWVDLL